jgi:hypothetical protein
VCAAVGCSDVGILLLLLLLLLLQVAGSARGVSAFQMDIKVEGITLDIMRQVGRVLAGF